MKKLLLLFALVAMFVGQVQAQEFDEESGELVSAEDDTYEDDEDFADSYDDGEDDFE